MKIVSESIADYVDLNYDILFFDDIKELEKVEELVINRFNYSMEEALFYPNELKYFRNLKKIVFVNFEISDDIINSLNMLPNLSELHFDCCFDISSNFLKVEKIYMESTKYDLRKLKNLKELIIENCGVIDVNDIILNNLAKLTILNTNIRNAVQLKEIKCSVNIIGCVVDNIEEIRCLDNVKYDSNQFKKII